MVIREDVEDGGPIAFPLGTDESTMIQYDMVRRMNQTLRDHRTHEPINWHYKPGTTGGIRCILRCAGSYCMDDPYTGKPLSYGEVYDMHAMTLLVIDEVEKRGKAL